MSTTTAPYDTKTGYAKGAGVPHMEAPRRAHRKLHCVDFILRVLTALATGAAIITILKSNETVRLGGVGIIRIRWNDFAAFKWYLLANAIVCTYAILAALASLIGVCTRRGPLSSTPIAWLTFLVDFLLTNALMSAVAAATAVAWVGKKGESAARWPSNCDMVKGFCRRIAGSLIATYAGWLFMALSTIVAASALHKLRRRTVY